MPTAGRFVRRIWQSFFPQLVRPPGASSSRPPQQVIGKEEEMRCRSAPPLDGLSRQCALAHHHHYHHRRPFFSFPSIVGPKPTPGPHVGPVVAFQWWRRTVRFNTNLFFCCLFTNNYVASMKTAIKICNLFIFFLGRASHTKR